MSNIWPPGTSLGEDFCSPGMTNCCTCCAYLVSNFVLQGRPWKVTSDIQVCLWKTISKSESSSWLSHEGHSHSWDNFFRWQDLATVARFFYENVTWYIILDIWYMISDTWYLILDMRYMISNTWYLIPDTWYLILFDVVIIFEVILVFKVIFIFEVAVIFEVVFIFEVVLDFKVVFILRLPSFGGRLHLWGHLNFLGPLIFWGSSSSSSFCVCLVCLHFLCHLHFWGRLHFLGIAKLNSNFNFNCNGVEISINWLVI